MDTALLLILLIIGNLALYWVLFGKKRFDKKFSPKEEDQTP